MGRPAKEAYSAEVVILEHLRTKTRAPNRMNFAAVAGMFEVYHHRLVHEFCNNRHDVAKAPKDVVLGAGGGAFRTTRNLIHVTSIKIMWATAVSSSISEFTSQTSPSLSV